MIPKRVRPSSGRPRPASRKASCLRSCAVVWLGGPIAHIGYFRTEFVTKRRWLGERACADLVASCQFASVPASSQVGFSLELIRPGWLGGLTAWCGVALPSALLVTARAFGADALTESPAGAGCCMVSNWWQWRS